MTSRPSLPRAVLAVALLLPLSSDAVLVWDAGQNLASNELVNGAEANPNPVAMGVWSYGSKTSPASIAFTPFTIHTESLFGDPTVPGWHGGDLLNTPHVGVNVTNVTLYNVPPANLHMHPGSNRVATLRFTAPGADTYTVTFSVMDAEVSTPPADGVSVDLVRGTSILASATIPEGGANLFTLPISLASGQTLDFVIGRNADSSFDRTAVSVTVQRVILTTALDTSLFDGRRWVTASNTSEGILYTLEETGALGSPTIWSSVDQFVATNHLHGIGALPGDTASPAFYRLRLASSEPPRGLVWVQGQDVVIGQTGVAEPVHTNYVSSFWMDATEVTKAMWDDVCTWALTNGYTFDNAGSGKATNHPVVSVNWYDCVKWCNARSQKEGLGLCYFLDSSYATPYTSGSFNLSNAWVNGSATGYRLPTEAEWEAAARGGWQSRRFPWGGDTLQHALANYYSTNALSYDTSPTSGYHPTYATGGFPYTCPVRSFPANAVGLFDLEGNVSEYCWDWAGAYSTTNQVDPRGPETGTRRIWRGSNWRAHANFAQCASRADADPTGLSQELGFRCVRRP